ncbi:hypothetical protein EVAR_33370_1 [Eumeta japonica]|uniref:Uncharacterized protein n=1 Tax=Eumeta variegata TaxID=151549 RepID=A0A4C1X499_EUMVA|nr:hypothetical protein EVAR_33370_1 [Eumeta japonica]
MPPSGAGEPRTAFKKLRVTGAGAGSPVTESQGLSPRVSVSLGVTGREGGEGGSTQQLLHRQGTQTCVPTSAPTERKLLLRNDARSEE